MSRSLEDKVEMIFVSSASNNDFQAAAKLFNDRYPDRPTSKKYLQQLMNKFKTTGSVNSAISEKINKPPISPTTEMNILWELIENPQLTSKDISEKYNVSKQTVTHLIKKNKYRTSMIRKRLNLDSSLCEESEDTPIESANN